MTDTAAPRAPQVIEAPRSQWADVWNQFRRHKGAMAGLVVLSVLVVLVVFGPMVWKPDMGTTAQAILNRNKPPSWAHPLGIDQVGQDVLRRMMQGGRVSLAVGLVAMMVSIFLGTLVGVLSGYFRRLDGLLMRVTDLFLALPLLPLLLVLMFLYGQQMKSVLGPEMGAFVLVVLGIGLTSWMHSARIVRGQVLALKEREFVLAARSIGTPPRRIIIRHILPNVMSAVMVAATLCIAGAIITESVLSFLGLGFPPDFPTWGRLLFEGYGNLTTYPSRVVYPGVAISLTVLSVNYIGDGLRDALDPRIRGR
ncbi:ABC transporter permease [Neotabrizicola sp. VNH66]|uniref:ABC transporter permease n=1 Tax=Neotabrizicola sp. VNH66 TaxID=3400918 RepID=UPI003C128AE1